MDVIAGAASISQLGVYAQSVSQILITICKEITYGSELWREQASDIQQIVKILHSLLLESFSEHRGHCPLCANILPPLKDLFGRAQEVRDLILRPQKQGFLALFWSAAGTSRLISKAFKDLQAKGLTLQFAITSQTYTNSAKISTDISRLVEGRTMSAPNTPEDSGNRTYDFRIVPSAKQKGDDNKQVANNGWGEFTKSKGRPKSKPEDKLEFAPNASQDGKRNVHHVNDYRVVGPEEAGKVLGRDNATAKPARGNPTPQEPASKFSKQKSSGCRPGT